MVSSSQDLLELEFTFPTDQKNWKNYVLVLVILIGTITDMKIMAEMDGDTFVNLSDSVVPENNGPCGFIKTL